jgi:hypothetical protein
MVNASPPPLLEAMNMSKKQKTGDFNISKIRPYYGHNLLLYSPTGRNTPILGSPFFEQSNPTPSYPALKAACRGRPVPASPTHYAGEKGKNMSTKPTTNRCHLSSMIMYPTILHRDEKDKIFCESKPKKCIRLPRNQLHEKYLASFYWLPKQHGKFAEGRLFFIE